MASIMMMSSRFSIIKKQLHVSIVRLIKLKDDTWMPRCLCECYWLSSKLTQQVMLLEGCAYVMLPLENFGHCRCCLPLVFSCHCITITFSCKKSYFSFNYGTGQNKRNRMSWPVMTSHYLPLMEDVHNRGIYIGCKLSHSELFMRKGASWPHFATFATFATENYVRMYA